MIRICKQKLAKIRYILSDLSFAARIRNVWIDTKNIYWMYKRINLMNMIYLPIIKTTTDNPNSMLNNIISVWLLLLLVSLMLIIRLTKL